MTPHRTPLALAAGLVALQACTCGPATTARPCNSRRDCPAEQACIDGLCQTALDASRPGDAAGPVDGARADVATVDAGSDGSALDRATADLGRADRASADGAPDVSGGLDLLPVDRGAPDGVQSDAGAAPDGPAPDAPVAADRANADGSPADGPSLDRGVFDAGAGDVSVTDGAAGSDAAAVDWWDPRWSYRRQLRFDTRELHEDLEGFTVRVALTAARFDFGHALADGSDLRFIDDDGITVLPHEVEEWDIATTAPVAELWVRVQRLSASSTTDHIWLYHGRASGGGSSPPVDAWSPRYAAVWHLGATTLDSTANANHASAVDVGRAAGIAGEAALFDGPESVLDVGASASLASLFGAHGVADHGGMVSVWARPSTMGEANLGRLVDKSTDLYGKDGWVLSLYSGTTATRSLYFCRDGTLMLQGCASAANDVVLLGAWQHVALIFDDTTPERAPRFFVNGRPVALSAAGYVAPQAPLAADLNRDLAIGNQPYASARTFDGLLDEVRLHRGTPSDSWVLAEYLSVRDPGFVVYGPEEAR